MDQIELTVRGDGARNVPSAIIGYPRNKRYDYDGEGFAVIVTEQYFFRTNSTLQTTVIFDLVEQGVCDVTVIAGGGGSGFLQEDWGSESNESHRLLDKMQSYCEDHDLEIVMR